MNYDVGTCKECGKIAGITKDHKCANCGADRVTVPIYSWFHQEYQLTENQETVDRMDEMDNTEVKASLVGGAELKAGLRDLMVCIGIAVALLLFGLLCVKGAGGPVKGRMSFMGILFLIGAPVMLVVGVVLFLKRLFSGARAKTPEKAYDRFWQAVFETKTFSEKYESAEIAADKIMRSLPTAVRESVSSNQIIAWVEDLREMIAKTNAELAQKAAKANQDFLFDAKGDGDSLEIQNLLSEMVDEHKAIVSADLLVVRKWSRTAQNGSNTDSFNYKMSASVLHTKTTLLKAGEYWYVPDWMPKAQKGETTASC